ncbi:GNAT family N-acetyltransferase [Bacillus sp. AGMB 02131]|uniref:GNAT family N-acetyltransferase n=1 Tax=Peribacillus faecalis TaxID=2772559 RepID=A0A927CVP9_9BACI|nr:GNAT family N-acetyltransferase [Peribacillus faecalis]MBD3107936.1 GNAT family N-acetyltransferase [Peribacillus faecalis]
MLETGRCLIMPFGKTDLLDVKKLFINAEVRKFLGGIRQEESIQELFDDMLNSSDRSSFYWVIREKNTDAFIGLVSLDPHHDGVHLEISYQLLPNWWKKGYATEVVHMIINYAFNELHLTKVVAETQTANKNSCKLLERLGMELEQTITRFGAEQGIYSIKNYNYGLNKGERQ